MPRSITILFLASAPLWAQGTATIFGTVTDSTGSVVPNAPLTVVQVTTGMSRNIVSDQRGEYVIPQLPIGTYRLSAEVSGFKKFILSDITLQVNENRRVQIALEVGNVAESVTVQAEVAQVETRSGTIKEVVDARRIQELPLNGRNVLDLQTLVPGAGAVAARDQAQNDLVAINGTRITQNNYTLDGGDNYDPQFGSAAVFPNPDALEEFSIQTNSFAAEYGRNSGAQIHAISKSGTNQIHGSLYEFIRNEKLNARNFFASSVPPFRRNQFGGTLGGPVWIPKLYNGKDRTFLFFSWQSTRSRSAPSVVTATVPSAAIRAGVFPRVIRDPNKSNNPFPNNTIPLNRQSPITTKLLDMFVPLPNRSDGLYAFTPPRLFDQDQALVKLDHQISPNNRISGRLLKNWEVDQQTVNNLPGWYVPISYANNNVTATDTHIFSPTTLNALTFTYNDIGRTQAPHNPGNTFLSQLGANMPTPYTQTDIPAAMNVVVSGYFTAWTRWPLLHFRHTMQISDKFSVNRGSHMFKLGFDFRRTALDVGEFVNDCSCTYNGTIAGDAMADFLIDRPVSISQSSPSYEQTKMHELGVFAQVEWRASKRLTLNLGLRWDPYFAYTDELNSVSLVRRGAQSTIIPTAPLGMLFVGDQGVTNQLGPSSVARFAPRFGFAWDPKGNGRMSIRGGYGIFVSPPRAQNTLTGTRNQPFSVSITNNNPIAGMKDPYGNMPGGNPFPYTAPSTAEARKTAKFTLPMAVASWGSDFTPATIQQWNFNLQREFFGSYVVTAAYVGSKGNHLMMTVDMNPATYIPGASSTANQDARRLLAPNYTALNTHISAGNSTYHSGQLSFNKRFSRNFTVLAAYTWAKTLSIADPSPAGGEGGGTRNPFNLSMNRGRSNHDLNHRFVLSYVWDLPKLSHRPALLQHIAGGWQTNGIVSLQDGLPLTATPGSDRSLVGTNADYADLVGNPFLSTDRPRGEQIDQYFNKSAFAIPALGTFGNMGRGLLTGPGNATVNFGVFKTFRINEQHQFQFRSEFFNLFNRVNLGNPNMVVSNASFGRITSAGDPRVIQLALRYRF